MFNEFKKLVNACGNDVTLYHGTNKNFRITIEDFEGFDEHWHEIMREYDNEKAVNALLDWLETNCTEQCIDLYTGYKFPDFQVIVGHASLKNIDIA